MSQKEELITYVNDKYKKISKDQKYYYVRTQKGILYDEFVNKQRVGLEYSYLNFETLFKSKSKHGTAISVNKDGNNLTAYLDIISAKKAIKKNGDYTKDTQAGTITTIYNKVRNFTLLKKGDIVVIPSSGTNYLSFGRVRSSTLHMDVNHRGYSMYKDVEWISEHEEFWKLDSEFMRLKFTQHAISDVSYLKKHINQSIASLYIEDENVNLIFDIEKQTGIDGIDFASFLISYGELLTLINDRLDLNENVKFEVQMNVQSPGKVRTRAKRAMKAMGIASALLVAVNGDIGQNQELNNRVEFLLEDNATRDAVLKVDTLSRKLDINRGDLLDIFK